MRLSTISVALGALAVASAVKADQIAPVVSGIAEQATRGEALYGEKCAACHGGALEGGAGMALAGPDFVNRWSGVEAGKLVQTIRKLMPMDAPGTLTDEQAADVSAYVLQRNNVAWGKGTLGAESAERKIAFASSEIDFTPQVAQAGAALPPLPQSAASARPASHPAAPDDAEIAKPADGDWLTFNRNYAGDRFSPLSQITPANAGKLRPVCAFQFGLTGRYQPSPVVYKGRIYVTALNKTVALDGKTCRKIWEHSYQTSEPTTIVVNRGVALYRGAIYRGTPSGHLIALDAENGTLLWDARVSSARKGYFLSAAPVAFDGKVFIGEAGADFGAPGHVHAFDAATGKHLWTFNLVAQPGEKGSETWPKGVVAGGGGTWSSYAIDPEKKLIYAPSANPAPDWDASGRPGHNLYSNSMVALDTATGKLNWYAQQVSNDSHDWDTAAAPSLFQLDGKRYAAQGSKDGYLYVYDRDRRKQVHKLEVSRHLNAEIPVSRTPLHACPGTFGGIEWNGAAYSERDKAMFVNSVEWCGTYYSEPQEYVEGGLYLAGGFSFDPVSEAYGWVRSFDAATGKERWAWKAPAPMLSGVTPTAGGVLFTGTIDGDFLAFDSATGKELYSFNTGGAIAAGLSTYAVDDKQYVVVPSGNTSRTMWYTTGAASVFVFALDD